MQMLHSSNSVSVIVHLQQSPKFNLNKATSQTSGRRESNRFPRPQSREKRLTMAYVTNNRTDTATFGQRLVDLHEAALASYSNWRVYRTTLNELNSLSTREMADLGINPSMVKRIALEAAYGKAV